MKAEGLRCTLVTGGSIPAICFQRYKYFVIQDQ